MRHRRRYPGAYLLWDKSQQAFVVRFTLQLPLGVGAVFMGPAAPDRARALGLDLQLDKSVAQPGDIGAYSTQGHQGGKDGTR